MIIKKDDIDKAKKKLGDKAAQIIAEGLHIDKWNENELKGCCPFHKEDTPSFKWYKDNSCFKCFGCGKTFDILDYYVQYKNMSFMEACKKLFDQTNIVYDFSDSEISKFKRDYKYPKPETNTNTDKVDKYLGVRKISKKTIDYAGIKQDEKGNIVFEYRDENDVLLTVKYRPSHKVPHGQTKTWCQAGADTSLILFGMNQIDTTKPLIITEGEIDRLSLIECGFKNAVSVPFGAGNYGWIEYCWEWLEQFDKIIIWADNDDAGKNMRKEVIPRLGEWRCYEAFGVENDINLDLYKYGKDKIVEILDNIQEVPITDIIDYSDVKPIDLSKMEKIKSGISQLDRFIGGFFLGTVDIITGINGSGKSTFVNQVCVAEPVNQGYKTFVYSGELPTPILKNWIEFPTAGRRHVETIDRGEFQPKYYKVKKEAIDKINKWYKGKLFFYHNDLDNSKTHILEKMTELARKFGFKNFVLDNLMMIDLECSEAEKYTAQKKFILDLIKFTRKYNAVIHLIAHPRKIEAIRRLTKMDICGSGDIGNLAHYTISIHRVTDKEKEGVMNKKGDGWVTEPIQYDCLIDLFKNRLMGVQDKTIGVYYDNKSKRFYGDSDDIDKQFSWDTTIYKDELPQPEHAKKTPFDK